MRSILALLAPAVLFLFPLKWSAGQSLSSNELLKIFIDCEFGCDHDYFKQEMNYVNFMQNRQEADVFLQLTIRRTGGGGREYQLRVEGKNYDTIPVDTLLFFTSPDATDNIRRTEILKNIKRGLLPFMVQTSLIDYIDYDVNFGEMSQTLSNEEVEDPWNFWTFRLRLNAFFRGQEKSRFLDMFSSFSANRTTEEHKFFVSFNYNLEKSSFDLSEDEEFTAKNENSSVNLLYVNSLGDRWSIGFRSRVSTSTFGNIQLGAGLRPALEFNVFPYRQSSQRLFVFRYSIGPSYVNYEEITVFDKLEEWLYEQSVDIEFNQIKDWGDVNIELEYENYLHDWSQLSISINPEISWNLARGLSLNVFGQIGYISNLRNIQKSEIDANDILLQNRQLDTSFEYFSGFGVTYRFGSIFNNVVNPRF